MEMRKCPTCDCSVLVNDDEEIEFCMPTKD